MTLTMTFTVAEAVDGSLALHPQDVLAVAGDAGIFTLRQRGTAG